MQGRKQEDAHTRGTGKRKEDDGDADISFGEVPGP